MKRSQINKVGPRTRKRRAMVERLKKLMVSLGIISCELKLPGCLRDWAMGFAHSKKSRFIITDADWMEAVLSCPHCHQIIEAKPHDEMYEIVTTTIANRGAEVDTSECQ